MNSFPLRSMSACFAAKYLTIGIAAVALCWANAARAATATFSTTAPVVGTNDISQLTGHVPAGGNPANAKRSNVGGVSDDNHVYIDSGRPAQGQTFTTGGNPNGYHLTAVTLKQVTYSTYALVPDINYTIRVTLPSGGSLSVVSEENAFVPEDASNCSTCNFPTISGGGSQGAGSGRYITFTLANPVVLSPNTTYGFDVGGVSAGHYWETDGRACTPGGGGCTPVDFYANGTAYSTGVNSFGGGNGLGNTVLTPRSGDRVFVAKLTPLASAVAPTITLQPKSVTLYSGRTARFTGQATGSPPLGYQWRKNGINISNGGNISGVLTTTLTISNMTAADQGAYTLIATNSGGAATSSPPAILTVVAPPPAGNNYPYAIFTNGPIAYWRLNETGDPGTNPPAFEYASGLTGTYESVSQNGFNTIAGPRPSDSHPGFESTNSAMQSTGNTADSWVTVPGLNLNTNTVTFTAWVYPVGEQADDTGIFWTRSGTVAGIGYGGPFAGNDNRLIYCWNNAAQSTWGFQTGPFIPSDQWSFIAVVIEPTRAVLYLGSNGNLTNAINNVPHISEVWDGNGRIGGDPQGQNLARTFNGVIDEVAVFKRSLSFDEVNNLYGIARGAVQQLPPSIVNQPRSQALYAGHTARFNAGAVGSAPLVYQWRKNGINVSNGGNISGATTDSLTVSNVSAADVGAYTLVVTNALGRATSSPPATFTLVTPSGKSYEAAVRAATPVAYWRLNETGDPGTNTVAYDFWGGLVGIYKTAAQNGFSGIEGPRPPDFAGFETTNTSLRTTALLDQAWVTVPPLNLNTNTVTITAWINPASDQLSYQAIFYTRRSTTAGIQYTEDNQMGYTWNNGNQETWDFRSELRPPLNQWSFVALVINPTNAALYVYNTNGLFSTNNAIPHISEPWSDTAEIGADPDSSTARNFDGMIDEVAVFNYAFTPAQILSLYNSALGTAPPAVTLDIQKVGANIQLSWPQGTLLEATNVNGPYTTNNATSPYNFAPTGAAKFFRVKVQ